MERIDTKPISEEFEEHLKYAGERVLFSGKFGVGKTTFLKEFFQDHEQYIAIHLFPVNYSVASNEDIFQLIKFDILFELLRPEYDLKYDKIEFQDLLLASFFTEKKFLEILAACLSFLPKVGKKTSDLVKHVITWKNEFKEYENQTETDELKDVALFLEFFRKKQGSLYESDLHTELIENFLHQIKARLDKEIVLIIDDLERVDPEHLFRLLNIFSAHVDNGIGDNKFGFDKVLFVLDIENAAKIFQHRYGEETNFSGYIDKLFTSEIFQFDSGEYVREIILSVLNTIKIQARPKVQRILNAMLHEDNSFSNSLAFVLESMLLSRTLNLRKLIQQKDKVYRCKPYDLRLFTGAEVRNFDFHIVLIIDFIESFYESNGSFQKAIMNTGFPNPKETYSRSGRYLNWLGVNLIFFNDYDKHKLNRVNSPYTNKLDNETSITYSFQRSSGDISFYVDIKEITGDLDLKSQLIKAVSIIRDNKSLVED